MTFLYNTGIKLYKGAVALASLFNRKAALLHQGQKNWSHRLRVATNGKTGFVWIHAASLGEFEQGRPLIEYIRKNNADKPILVTFFSPSGYEVRKNYELADVVCYLPFDTKANVVEFLEIVKPSLAVFVKYEFWYNYLNALKARNIPTYSISTIFRKEQAFFKAYGKWYRKMLGCFDYLFVQDQKSADLLSSIGLIKHEVAGDTRFDRVRDNLKQAKDIDVVSAFCGTSKVLVVGSSWPKDEEMICQYVNNISDLKVIFAPHEVHEAHIAALEKMVNKPLMRYTEATTENVRDKAVLIVNTIGLLASVYKYADITYVGGGFGVGIHNILEAATFGKPIIFGPNYKKFNEAVDLVAQKGAFVVDNYETLKSILDKMLQSDAFINEAGAQSMAYVEANLGATKKIMTRLDKHL